MSRQSRKIVVVAAMAVVGVLAVPAFAGAQGGSNPTTAECGTPTTDQYGNQVKQFDCDASASSGFGDPSSSGLSDPVGPLPFTGFDVIALLGVALAVTGLGLGLQRAVSKQT